MVGLQGDELVEIIIIINNKLLLKSYYKINILLLHVSVRF